jgi:hypothetical protein
VTVNDRKVCKYHPGEMDRDGEFFSDFFDYGDRDSDADPSNFPEGYIWECCDKKGDEEGCKKCRHRDRDE